MQHLMLSKIGQIKVHYQSNEEKERQWKYPSMDFEFLHLFAYLSQIPLFIPVEPELKHKKVIQK